MLEKRLWWGSNFCGSGSQCLCTLGATMVPTSQAAMPRSCSTLAVAELLQAKKVLSLWIVTSVVSNSLSHCRLWLARLLSQGRGFYMQRYWCALANTGWHTLLEHYISCCPSHQLPWVPGAARTPVNQAVAPPHLALIGANPSPPGQSQEQTPVDDSHADMEIKPQLEPRDSVAKEEDPKPSYHLYKL